MLAGLPLIGSLENLPKNISADLSFFFMFAGLSLALGVFFGRFKLINILINAYIALAFISVLPSEIYTVSPYARVLVFAVLLIILTAIDKRLFDLHISSAGSDVFWRLIVMSLLVSGMLSSIIFSLLPKSDLMGWMSGHVLIVFASPISSIVWLALPLLVLLFINNRLK